ncbi:MAG: chemotaxis protein [Rhodoferax sp.]
MNTALSERPPAGLTGHQDVTARTRLAGNNQFELLLFRLGEAPGSRQRELFGINVFKVREVLVMPPVTELANAHPHLMGVANIRGQIIPVIHLPAVLGYTPVQGLSILMVTEFGRTVQAFAVEDVREIVRLDWDQVLPAEQSHAGALITGIARLDGARADSRLAQVLDVEQILRSVLPRTAESLEREVVGDPIALRAGTRILVADDSAVARSVIELSLKALGLPCTLTRTGKEAWEHLQADLADGGEPSYAAVLTDLEMPEMDGFTLTRMIKQEPRLGAVPVVIHSSLTGGTNENHVRSVGADGYVAKFSPRELSATLRRLLAAG